jgi:hypothetical protein
MDTMAMIQGAASVGKNVHYKVILTIFSLTISLNCVVLICDLMTLQTPEVQIHELALLNTNKALSKIGINIEKHKERLFKGISREELKLNNFEKSSESSVITNPSSVISSLSLERHCPLQ